MKRTPRRPAPPRTGAAARPPRPARRSQKLPKGTGTGSGRKAPVAPKPASAAAAKVVPAKIVPAKVVPAKVAGGKAQAGALEPLVAQALSMREKAYAPYSNFLVGAALLGASGKVYLGCNVENSSYGLCVCAERSAIARAVADGERKFKGIVIATQSSPPSPPCGMCRQTLAEFAPDLDMLLVNEAGARVKTTLHEIFPMSFTNSYL